MELVDTRPAWLPIPGGEVRWSAPWLRPLSVREILDRSFHVMRANYGGVARAVLVFSVPCEVLSAFALRNLGGGTSLLTVGSVAPTNSGGSGAWILVPYLVAVFGPALASASLCRVAAADILGSPLPAGRAWRIGLRRTPACLMASVVVTVLSALGCLFCVVPGVLLWTMWHLTIPIVSVERMGWWRALGRSWRLTKGRFGAVLSLVLIGSSVSWIVGQLLGLMPGALAGVIGLHWGFLLLAASSAVVATVTWSFGSISATIMYYDIRVRREGLDLAWRVAALPR